MKRTLSLRDWQVEYAETHKADPAKGKALMRALSRGDIVVTDDASGAPLDTSPPRYSTSAPARSPAPAPASPEPTPAKLETGMSSRAARSLAAALDAVSTLPPDQRRYAEAQIRRYPPNPVE